MLDRLMQLREVVARNGSVHVVLNVIVHVKIPEPHNRMKVECARASSEVVHSVLAESAMREADVLRRVAEPEKPTIVERAKAYHQRDKKGPATYYRHKCNGTMTKQQQLCPKLCRLTNGGLM